MKRVLFILPIVAILTACAPSEKSIPSGVDVFKVEQTANDALNLARVDSAQTAALALNLEFLSKRIDLLDSISSALPISAASENQMQIALLREEVSFLRRFLENQRGSVELINPQRKQPPQAANPMPSEYEQAWFLFNDRRDYANAAVWFEKATVLYPKSDWADDAWYWVGECQIALGNYAQAISAFEKVFLYNNSNKAADAQFQIGISLIRLGDREHATAAFRKVQEFYPKSPRALQAGTELNRLK
ncbi:hypothetical protein AGMMS49938_00280 [Fibrobacterales bacterium]|nr:hypothetical protein AGMMS49938_00280 [Fibrobacterales bacterium]